MAKCLGGISRDLLIYKNLITSPILISILLALTSVEYGTDAKPYHATTKPVGHFVNVLNGVSKSEFFLKQDKKIRELCLKQGKGLRDPAAPCYLTVF